jgi:Zn-finger nucleic acid-binding protein
VENALLCPACRIELAETRLPFGRFWKCATCGGHAITVEMLRHAFTAESINPLWLHAISHEGQPGRPCPLCARPMLTVAFSGTESTPIDVCPSCHLVWFDRGEIESLTPQPPKSEAPPISSQQRQAAAIAKVAALAQQARAEHHGRAWTLIQQLLTSFY